MPPVLADCGEALARWDQEAEEDSLGIKALWARPVMLVWMANKEKLGRRVPLERKAVREPKGTPDRQGPQEEQDFRVQRVSWE